MIRLEEILSKNCKNKRSVRFLWQTPCYDHWGTQAVAIRGRGTLPVPGPLFSGQPIEKLIRKPYCRPGNLCFMTENWFISFTLALFRFFCKTMHCLIQGTTNINQSKMVLITMTVLTTNENVAIQPCVP